MACDKQWRERNKDKVLAWYEQNKDKCRQQAKAWKNNHRERWHEIGRKHNFKRRSLGFVCLNKPFGGSEAHHIDKDRVIYIPKNIHRSIYHNIWTGKNIDEINRLAWEWVKHEGET